MVPLFAASDSMVNVFLGLFDKPLDNPAPFDCLLELTTTLVGVMASGLDLHVLIVCEPAQMPLEDIQGTQANGDGL